MSLRDRRSLSGSKPLPIREFAEWVARTYVEGHAEGRDVPLTTVHMGMTEPMHERHITVSNVEGERLNVL
jgi:hypothetical protein